MTNAVDPSGTAAGGPGRHPYMISGEPGVLLELEDELKRDPAARVRRRAGSADQPKVLSADLRPEDTDQLRARYGPSVELERDQPLGMS